MDAWLEVVAPYGPTLDQLGGILPPGAELVAVHGVDDATAYELRLRSHRCKVDLLDRLADFDAADPRVRRIAEHLTSHTLGAALPACQALHQAIRDGVTFAPEPAETFQHSLRTIETMRGDCDDSARALVALARSIGIGARLRTLNDPPTHVYAELRATGAWLPAETTIAAMLGEHPLDAYARLRPKNRGDIR